MAWFKDTTLGPKTASYAELSENLYEVLTVEGEPSTPQEPGQQRLNAVTLGIQADKVERFAEKRLLTYEALLFLAVQVVTETQSEQLQKDLGDAVLHPLAMEIETLIEKMWRERGIDVPDVSAICFNEVDEFFEEPFQWGRSWLEEFYSDRELLDRHYSMWTDQCRKDFEVMRTVVGEYT